MTAMVISPFYTLCILLIPAVFTFHIAGIINVLCHTLKWGYRNFDTKDTSVNIKKLAQIIGTMFNKQVKINKYSNKDVDCYVPNINKAKKKLKLKINYDLKESINLTINNNYEKVN